MPSTTVVHCVVVCVPALCLHVYLCVLPPLPLLPAAVGDLPPRGRHGRRWPRRHQLRILNSYSYPLTILLSVPFRSHPSRTLPRTHTHIATRHGHVARTLTRLRVRALPPHYSSPSYVFPCSVFSRCLFPFSFAPQQEGCVPPKGHLSWPRGVRSSPPPPLPVPHVSHAVILNMTWHMAAATPALPRPPIPFLSVSHRATSLVRLRRLPLLFLHENMQEGCAG